MDFIRWCVACEGDGVECVAGAIVVSFSWCCEGECAAFPEGSHIVTVSVVSYAVIGGCVVDSVFFNCAGVLWLCEESGECVSEVDIPQ